MMCVFLFGLWKTVDEVLRNSSKPHFKYHKITTRTIAQFIKGAANIVSGR